MTIQDLSVRDLQAWLNLAHSTKRTSNSPQALAEATEEFHNALSDDAVDVVGAFMGANLLGCFEARITGSRSGATYIALDALLRPESRSIELLRSLVAAMVERARLLGEQQSDEARGLRITADASDQLWVQALKEAGFVTTHSATTMRRALKPSDKNPMVVLPPGLTFAPFNPTQEADAQLALHNEVFGDVPGSPRWATHHWQEMLVDKPAVRHDLSTVIRSANQIVAYAHTEVWDEDEDATTHYAWIARIGVHESCRKFGLGTALINQVLSASAQAGLPYIELEVEPNNPTEPIRLYQRLGFKETSTELELELMI